MWDERRSFPSQPISQSIKQEDEQKRIDVLHSSIKWWKPTCYRICIVGHLDEKWSVYCGGMTITPESTSKQSPVTSLTGRLIDQGSLLGVLTWLHNTGYTILSIEGLEAG